MQSNKPKLKKGTVRRLLSYFKRYKWQLSLAIAVTIIANVFVLIGPMLSGKAIDAIGNVPGKVNFHKVFYYAFWMLLFYVLSALLSFSLNFLITWIGQHIVVDMRKELFHRMEHLPIRFFR